VSSSTGIEKCCQVPSRSTNFKSTICTLCFFANSTASRGFIPTLLNNAQYAFWGIDRLAHEPINILLEGRTNGIQPSMVLDLTSILVRHIEHVNYLMPADCAQGLLYVIVQAGRDPGRMDRQTELKYGMRDDIQQPLRIVGEYIDDRESVVDPVIDHHLSCVMGCRQTANIRQAGVSTYQLI